MVTEDLQKFTSKRLTVSQAEQELRLGHPVAIPTETVYGLAAPISNSGAIEKIFAIKRRPFFDPLIVHIASLSQVSAVSEQMNPIAEKLAEKFWPGPLTIILPKKKNLNPMITSGLETVGVRMPRHPIALELIRAVGPLAAPSANLFGKTSPTNFEHVLNELSEVGVVDGGPSTVGIESTVVEPLNDKILVYRQGGITVEMLKLNFPDTAIEVAISPVSPGHMKHHYMPKKPLILLLTKPQLSYSDYDVVKNQLGFAPSLGWLQLSADAGLAARQLYAEMRAKGEDEKYDALIVDASFMSSRKDLWGAIFERLSKAATFTF